MKDGACNIHIGFSAKTSRELLGNLGTQPACSLVLSLYYLSGGKWDIYTVMIR